MSMMIAQSASSVAGCIQEKEQIVVQLAHSKEKPKAVKIPPVPQYWMLELQTRL